MPALRLTKIAKEVSNVMSFERLIDFILPILVDLELVQASLLMGLESFFGGDRLVEYLERIGSTYFEHSPLGEKCAKGINHAIGRIS